METYKPSAERLIAFIFEDATWWSLLIGAIILLGVWVFAFMTSTETVPLEERPVAVAAKLLIIAFGSILAFVTATNPVIFVTLVIVAAVLTAFILAAAAIAHALKRKRAKPSAD